MLDITVDIAGSVNLKLWCHELGEFPRLVVGIKVIQCAIYEQDDDLYKV